jgi:hypothetical protein
VLPPIPRHRVTLKILSSLKWRYGDYPKVVEAFELTSEIVKAEMHRRGESLDGLS